MSRKKVIGILREVKYKWERRAPLAPPQVQRLTERGVQVLVQPSDRRIFTNGEYAAAGAIVTEDISAANTIFGVKEVAPETMIPGKTYVIFSHVIKAQPYNMPLLDTAARRNVRLVDYECIRAADGGGRRLVAFGRYAGIAGMVDYLRGMGERLLTLGYSTPFMGVSNSFMYPSVDAARSAVRAVGNEIERVGLPAGISPLSFVFTGSGNVTQGAREIFDLLPHQLLSAPELEAAYPAGLAPSDVSDADRHRVIGCMARLPDLVQPIGGDPAARADIDRAHYYEHPSEYRPVFHERVAPYTGALINGMYWDSRFPRLLTTEQGRALGAPGGSRTLSGFLGVSDITCDVGGSVEFLTRSTDLEAPFFVWNPATGESELGLGGDGFLMQGVDILPAQFPRDATEHFSKALEPFVEALALPAAEGQLPPEIENAVITRGGEVAPSYRYIQQLREANERAAAKSAEAAAQAASSAEAPADDKRHTTSLMMSGHLFDSGFINKTLDLAEYAGAECQFDQWVLGHSQDARSRCVVVVRHADSDKLRKVVDRIRGLVEMLPTSEAEVEVLPETATRARSAPSEGTISFGARAGSPATQQQQQQQGSQQKQPLHVGAPTGDRVLVLGSGFVAGPVVEYLVAHGHEVVVGGADAEQARRLVRGMGGGATAMHLDAAKDADAVREQVRRSRLVVSLLPATMHVPVAEMCIDSGVHLVTASYTSPAMRELDERAREAGVSLVNEVGLDPGLDHMSAMEVVHAVERDGGRVVGFESLCGGLPAPEAADNPFGYKFSWNPRGVLTASQNPAVYLRDGRVERVAGADLLGTAEPVRVLPSLSLERLPNRNSLAYLDTYGFGKEAEPEAGPMRDMYRGTLRYAGFSSIMNCFASLGLLNPERRVPDGATTWAAAMSSLTGGGSGGFRDALARAERPHTEAEIEAAADAASWLGIRSRDTPIAGGQPFIDELCKVLERRLAYQPGERDMVVMAHRFQVDDGDGRGAGREITSTMMAYGTERASAMALTVGLPTAVAAQLVLSGKYARRGATVPVTADLYAPILEESAQHGIVFKESERPLR